MLWRFGEGGSDLVCPGGVSGKLLCLWLRCPCDRLCQGCGLVLVTESWHPCVAEHGAVMKHTCLRMGLLCSRGPASCMFQNPPLPCTLPLQPPFSFDVEPQHAGLAAFVSNAAASLAVGRNLHAPLRFPLASVLTPVNPFLVLCRIMWCVHCAPAGQDTAERR